MNREGTKESAWRRRAMFGRIGGILGLAFYAAQGVALGGGLIVMVISGKGAGDVWLGWTAPPMVVLGIALVIGLPLVGAAMALWRIAANTEYGSR